ncbi:MAG: hypothetical protein QME73_13575, partial [Bacillota bacterium]|nr:hypothetical protein [Bacillota bacterium]
YPHSSGVSPDLRCGGVSLYLIREVRTVQELFTYVSLGTLSGAVTATMLVVQFLKEIGPLKRFPTRWLVFGVAQGIVLAANVSTGNFSVINIPICFLNGLLVAFSALGSWHVLHDSLTRNKRKKTRSQ